VTGRDKRGAKAARRWAVVSAGVLGLTVACAGAQDANGTDGGPALSDRVMSALRAAGEARAQLLKERQEWDLQKQQLELLKSTVLREAERHKRIAATARQAQAELEKQRATQTATRRRLESVEAMVDALCERLEKALAGVAKGSLPGIVPPDRAAGITQPGRRLAAAVERLEEARRRTRRAGVEVVGGTLNGRSVAVRLLRAGGAAAWWLSLDGKQAGTAELRGGDLILRPAPDPQDVQAIRKAFAIAEGRGTPDWALLPVPPSASKD